MISELRIRGLGVIDDAVVPFSPGLTVLTGETGAGKTMVLSGLGLIMGRKADAGDVRTGSPRADADGEWLLDPADAVDVVARLEEAGADVEIDGGRVVLLLSRSVAAEGRSKAFAGGRSVPAGVLAEITEHLIAVHGQSDQALLREARQQRDLLDRFGGAKLAATIGEYRTAFADWREAESELRELVDSRTERLRDAALLRHGIDEIAAVQPVSGEDEALKSQATVLAHSTDLIAEIGSARALLAGDDDASVTSAAESVAQARRSVDRAAALDASLLPLLAQFDGLVAGVDSVAAELGHYLQGIDADPQQQAAVEERRQQISALKRRYGPGLDDVLDWWASAEQKVGAADGADARIEQLTEQAARLRESTTALAARLTKQRTAAAGAFSRAVSEELHALAMADAELSIALDTTIEITKFTVDGADTVAMLLKPHAGSEPRPLARGASGGELSRIMLAIEVVLAGVNSVPTFVFDEVDAGIGGKVAVEVGRRLARLARTAQVIVVTHLPQVAAFADRHVVVSKDQDGRVTAASVSAVEGEDRVRELVRMLSGLEDSQSGAEHAAELLALAAGERA